MKREEHIARREKLYTAVGRALTSWGRIEHELCLVFCNCINHTQANPADNAFWSILSFEGKLRATHSVFENRFVKMRKYEKIRLEWLTQKNHLQKRNKIRNKLAHGSVVTMSWRNQRGNHEDTFFAPYYYSQKLNHLSYEEHRKPNVDFRPKDRLTEKDINKLVTQYRKDARALSDLGIKIRELSEAEEA